ncbi:MAG: hypothetical protein VX444_07660 [Pseudomonadota bacterium]|nr:hypothetical protein [Pseudomonadota bacterium]
MIRLAGIVLALSVGPIFAATSSELSSDSATTQKLSSMRDLSDEDYKNRCYSLSHAVYIHRNLMRNNPIHGDRNAAKNLDWVDGLQMGMRAAGVEYTDGALEFVDDYIDLLGPVRPTIDLSRYPRIALDKQNCLNRYGNGDE